jgi:YD repeat-containing protein
MKKLLLNTFIILLTSIGYSQDESDSDFLNLSNIVKVPNSPEAEAFIKYGNTPVNYFNGTINLNIPIYTIQGQEISFPISLNYDSSGLKVSSVATKIGAGWNINDSGVISRVVVGEPDGTLGTGNNVYDSYISTFIDYIKENVSIIGGQHHPEAQIEKYLNILNLNKNRNIDLAADYFQVSLPGLSGTIFVDYKNNKVRFTNNPEVKVEVIGLTNGIQSWKLTNSNGVQYFFNSIERTKHFFSEPAQVEFNRTYNSSWRLTKIISQNKKDTIEFVYDNVLSTWTETENLHTDSVRNVKLSSSNCNASDDISTASVNEYKIENNEIQEIKYNNNTIIDFIYASSERLDLKGKKALEQIVVKSKFENIKGFNLKQSYFGTNNSYNSNYKKQLKYRLKLDEIEILDKNLNKVSNYVFTYYKDRYAPARNSKSIDFWGYNNGASNSHLFSEYTTPSGVLIGGADRTSNLINSKIGALVNVKYPTGGTEVYEYELNQIKELLYNNAVTEVVDNQYLLNNSSSLATGYCDDFMSNPRIVKGGFVIKEGDNSNVSLSFTNSNSTNQATYNYGQQLIIYKTNTEIGLCNLLTHQVRGIFVDDSYNNPESGHKVLISGVLNNQNGLINLGVGTYRFVMLNSNPYVTMSLTKSRIVTDTSNSIQKVNVGGLRIASISSFDNGQLKLKKKLVYPIGIRQQPIIFKSETRIVDPSACSSYIFYPNLLRSSFSNSPVTYSKVIEKQLSTNEQNLNTGEVIYDFYNNGEESIYLYPMNKSLLNGQIKKISYLDKSGALKKEVTNKYKQKGLFDIYPFYASGLDLKQNRIFNRAFRYYYKNGNNSYFYYEEVPEGFGYGDGWTEEPRICRDPKMNCLFGSFYEYRASIMALSQKWYYLDKATTIEFFEDEKVINTTKYIYSNLNHFQPTETQTTDSKGVVLKTKIEYAHEKNDTKLISENRIATPLNQKSYKGTTELSEQNSIYKDFGGNYLPKKVQTSKGSNVLEDRIIYHNYDDKGNPIEVSKKDGTKIYYVWGYEQTQPIAKIENYTSLTEGQKDLIDRAIAVSNNDNDRTIDTINPNGTITKVGNEGNLREALRNLRENPNMLNTQVTTFTYDPLIGVTSTTDPTGQTLYYDYDSFHRLKYVMDKEGKVMSKNEYNYKN